MSADRPGGAPFIDRMPKSVIKRSREPKTAAARCSVCNEKNCTQPTHRYCADAGGEMGESNSTHHLVPRARSMTCRYCGQTEKQIRDSL